jgi:hypothetical protein
MSKVKIIVQKKKMQAKNLFLIKYSTKKAICARHEHTLENLIVDGEQLTISRY